MEYDGESVEFATNIFDVLNPNDDGSHPEYVITKSANGTEIIISIPYFSKHTVTIHLVEKIVETLSSPIAVLIYIITCLIGTMAFVYPIIAGLISFRGNKKL